MKSTWHLSCFLPLFPLQNKPAASVSSPLEAALGSRSRVRFQVLRRPAVFVSSNPCSLSGHLGICGKAAEGGLRPLWPVSQAPGLSLPVPFSSSIDEMFCTDTGLLLPPREASHVRQEVWNVPCRWERCVGVA